MIGSYSYKLHSLILMFGLTLNRVFLHQESPDYLPVYKVPD